MHFSFKTVSKFDIGELFATPFYFRHKHVTIINPITTINTFLHVGHLMLIHRDSHDGFYLDIQEIWKKKSNIYIEVNIAV